MGSQSTEGSSPHARQRGADRGEALAERLESGGVEPEVVDALVEHPPGHRTGDDVTGLQLVHEPLALGVPNEGAVTPERLGQQGPRHLRVVQRGRVELHEFGVGHGRAGAQGHRDPVAGALDGIGRDREELAGATGGQQHVGGAHETRPTARRLGRRRHGIFRRRPRRRARTTTRARPRRSAARLRPAPVRSPRRWRLRPRAPRAAGCGRPRGRARGGPARHGRRWHRAR